MSEILLGLCHCGCGGATRVSPRNDARRGIVKGLPVRYIPGHQRRMAGGRRHQGGYVLVAAPTHPKQTNGRILEHVFVVERALGHLLPDGAVVHHRNEDKADNANSNLVVLQSQSEHMDLHARLRVLRAGGNPWTQRLCCSCHTPKDLDQFYKPKDRAFASRCIPCSRARAIDQQRAKREAV